MTQDDNQAEPRARAMDRRDFVKQSAGAGAFLAMMNAGGESPQAQAPAPASIDVHAHWTPEPYLKALADVGAGGGRGNELNVDMAKRVAFMDSVGVQVSCLTILTPPWDWASAQFAAKLTAIVNDAAIEAHQKFPTRLVAGVAMPVQNAEMALKELNRVAGNPAFRGVHLPNSLNGRDFVFEKSFEPILARCQELGYPLLFHPVTDVPGADRLTGPAFLNNTVGFPMEHTIVAGKFITTGLLDKYPKLDIVLAHAGGAFPYVAGRIDWGLYRQDVKTVSPFKDYIRRFHYDTLAYYPETLRFLIDLVGADRVVIGTDEFATMDVPKPNALVEELNLPAAQRDLIFRGNAMRLLKM